MSDGVGTSDSNGVESSGVLEGSHVEVSGTSCEDGVFCDEKGGYSASSTAGTWGAATGSGNYERNARIVRNNDRNFKNFSKENFVNDLAGVLWKALDAYADVDKKLECWNAMFMDVLNKHIPLVTRRVKNKQIPGWMNRDIIRQICVRDKLKAPCQTQCAGENNV